MGGKFSAEKFWIWAGYNQILPSAMQPVHEKLPAFDVLDLIKKEVLCFPVYF